MQEKEIAKLEKEQNIEINHCYTWYTVNGEVVLGIDPPVPWILSDSWQLFITDK